MISIYIHFPFCRTRCGYCDFNTYAGREDLIPEYIEALCKEIEWIGSTADRDFEVHSIYLGGGTPSLIGCNNLEKILNIIKKIFIVKKGCEITLEINPCGVSRDYFECIYDAGINRISIGVQSFNYLDLKILERNHVPFDVYRAVESAKRAGFSNISLDLIFGIPRQTLQSWQKTIKLAVDLRPTHLSLYSLILEPKTPLYKQIMRGLVEQIDDDLAADMYEFACDYLENYKFKQYEISNWGFIDDCGYFYYSRHNMQYWKNLEYIGIGAGAHGYIQKIRTINCLSPRRYNMLSKKSYQKNFPKTFATIKIHKVNKNEEMNDFMLLGLRLVDEGVSRAEFNRRFDTAILDVYSKKIINLMANGLLEFYNDDQQDSIRLTKRGKLLANQVFREFV